MMLNPTEEELKLKEEISKCKDEKKKKDLENELFLLEEKRFDEIRNSHFANIKTLFKGRFNYV